MDVGDIFKSNMIRNFLKMYLRALVGMEVILLFKDMFPEMLHTFIYNLKSHFRIIL